MQRIGISDSAVKPGALPKRIAYSQFGVPGSLFRAVRQVVSDLPAAAHEKDMVCSRPPNFFVAPQGRPRRRAIDPSQAVGQSGGVKCRPVPSHKVCTGRRAISGALSAGTRQRNAHSPEKRGSTGGAIAPLITEWMPSAPMAASAATLVTLPEPSTNVS